MLSKEEIKKRSFYSVESAVMISTFSSDSKLSLSWPTDWNRLQMFCSPLFYFFHGQGQNLPQNRGEHYIFNQFQSDSMAKTSSESELEVLLNITTLFNRVENLVDKFNCCTS